MYAVRWGSAVGSTGGCPSGRQGDINNIPYRSAGCGRQSSGLALVSSYVSGVVPWLGSVGRRGGGWVSGWWRCQVVVVVVVVVVVIYVASDQRRHSRFPEVPAHPVPALVGPIVVVG